MAKNPSGKSNGTSRIRFIMLDAEIPEGDLSQITAAIQNALKPTTIIQQRLPSSTAGVAAAALEANNCEPELDETLSDLMLEDAPTINDSKRPVKEVRARKYPTPKVLELDLTSGLSFESYALGKPPKTDTDRFLVVAAWFKEHRDEDAITANHVYTCYRAMKWPSGIEDFSWPLRALKKEQLMSSSGRGLYAINHLGIARVDKLGRDVS